MRWGHLLATLPPANTGFAPFMPYAASFLWPEHGEGKSSPRMMPLGAAGGCQISRTDVVLTSGKRMPMGGPGTGGAKKKWVTVSEAAAQP